MYLPGPEQLPRASWSCSLEPGALCGPGGLFVPGRQALRTTRPDTFHSSNGASLMAPREIITHYVTRKEERELSVLMGLEETPAEMI